MTRQVFLSKSKLMSARQCLKRLHLEVHRPELKSVSAETEAAFRKGREVGDAARRIYGTGDAAFIPFDGGLKHAIAKTSRLLAAAAPAPIFEATLQYNGVLVRIDVLIPDGSGWRLVEVKASTSVKPEHGADCAIQVWVFRRSGFELNGVALAHVDNTFVYRGDGDYSALLREEDLDDDVDSLLPSVPEWVSEARAAVSGAEPAIAVGKHCFTPYECPFVSHCWPTGAQYPLLELGGRASKGMLAGLVQEGFTDVRHIPDDRLNDTQRRIQRITKAGAPELLAGAREFERELEYPRYFVDFETVAPPVPVWPDTRPYESLPFQWSCHYAETAGSMQHAEFLDLTGDAPARRFAESLIRALGTRGPVIVYSSYEKRIIDYCIERYPELRQSLESILERLVDLLPVTRDNYYHPDMGGSWSIKSVLPTVAPDMSYAELEGVQDGSAASEAYLEAVDAGTTDARRAELRQQLLDYCRHDTLSMVRLLQFFATGTAIA